MIEMRGGEDLKYSNQIPGWAKIIHIILISIVALIGLAAFILGGYFIFSGDWLGAVLCIFVGLVVVWATRMMIIGSKLHTDFVFLSELRDEGYYTYFKNIKNNYEEEHLIPFHRMHEVLIARKSQYVSSGSRSGSGYYVIGSQIVMQWQDEYGNTEYSLFGIASRSDLSKWIEKFQEHHVPVFNSLQNVSEASTADFLSGYAELEKAPLTSLDLVSDVETRRYNNIPLWLSSEMKQRKAQKQLMNDRKIFRPAFAVAMLMLFFIAMLWMPHWPVEEEVFTDSSPSLGVYMIIICFIIISRTYWRRNRRWFQPITDILFMLAASFAGLTAAKLWQPVASVYYDAALVDVLTAGFFLSVIFIVFKLLQRRDRIE